MSPRTKAQFEQMKCNKKKMIVECARNLFAKKGFESTSITQISSSAGISKGLMYSYFRSKEELFKSIIDKGIDDLVSLFNFNNDKVFDAEEMQSFIIRLFKQLQENKVYWQCYFQILMQEKVFVQAKKQLEESYQPIKDKIVRHFNNAGFLK